MRYPHRFCTLSLVAGTILLLSCEKASEPATPRQPSGNAPWVPKIMSYHFGVEHLSVSRQVQLLDSLKMDGIMVQIETATLGTLEGYYQTPEVKSGKFHLYNVFTSVSLDDATARRTQLATIEAIYQKIQQHETVLQVLLHGAPNNPNTTAVLTTLADIASKYHKQVLIYPHEGLAIETAEQAVAAIQKTARSNVYVALHLCHELAAGHGARIAEVTQTVAPYIKAVSISGATLSEKASAPPPMGWFWAIKPLYMGTYDLSAFCNALYRNNYKGPIAIHTYGIYENFRLTPKEHLPQSREVLLNLANSASR